MNKLIIVGAGGHGKVVADIAALSGYEDIAFLDDNETVKSCLGYPVVGKLSDAKKYVGSDFVVAMGNSKARESMITDLSDLGLNLISLIHPKAVIAKDASIGEGTVIAAGAVVNPGAIVGKGCIINTGSTVDHDNRVGDFVHISVGCHLGGTVTVGDYTWLGAGVIVDHNISVCPGCVIRAGAVVVNDIGRPGTYDGVPAAIVRTC